MGICQRTSDMALTAAVRNGLDFDRFAITAP